MGDRGKTRGDAPYSQVYVYYVLGMLNLAYMLALVDRLVLSLVIDPVRKDLDLSETHISLLLGFAFALFYTAMGLPFGRMVDRGNRRGIIALGIGFWSLATMACGLAKNFWMLFAARLGVGVGEATIAPAAYSMIPDYVRPDQRGIAMALFAIGSPIGAALFMWGGGHALEWANATRPSLPLLGQIAPWQLAFIVAGLPGLLLAALIWITVAEPGRRIVKNASASAPTIKETFAYIGLHWKTLVPAMLAFSAAVTNSYVFMTWGPAFFMRMHGMSPSMAGFVMAMAFGLVGSIAVIVGGMISDRMIARGKWDAPFRVTLFGSCLALPLFAIAYTTKDTNIAVPVFIGAVFCCTLYGALQAVSIQNLTPSRMRGQMAAIYLTIANVIGLGITPTLTALMTDYWFGKAAMGWSMAVTSAIALTVTIILLITTMSRARDRAKAIFESE